LINRCNICGRLLDTNSNMNENAIIEKKCSRCNSNNINLKTNNSINSLFYIFDGLKLLIKNKKILKLSVIPLIITFLVLAGAYASFIYIFLNNLGKYLASGQEEGFYSNVINLSKYVFGIFGSLIITIITLFLFLPISSLICIPFNDVISKETEKILLGSQPEESNVSLMYEVKVGLIEIIKLLFFKIVILIFALPLNLIPGFGNFLFLFILALITSIDFLDIIMARKRYNLKEKIEFIKLNFVPFIAFSFPLILLFWIPLFQILIIPAAAIGGTIFFLSARKNLIE
jgi:CysZ protein